MSAPERSQSVSLVQRSIAVRDGALPITLARGDGRGAAVVVMPSAFGITEGLQQQMRELAVDATAVVTIDPFFRFDAGVVPYDDMTRVIGRLQRLDTTQAEREFHAAVQWVRDEFHVASVLALGICFGGPFALRAAADRVVQGAVTWHGTRMEQHLDRASEIVCPMHLHFGAVDPFVSMDAVERIRSALAHRDDVHIAVHANATHGFSHRDAPQAFHPDAERAAMASVRALIAQCG
jgi:carboxymethylenebutenolidase